MTPEELTLARERAERAWRECAPHLDFDKRDSWKDSYWPGKFKAVGIEFDWDAETATHQIAYDGIAVGTAPSKWWSDWIVRRKRDRRAV